MLLKTSGIIIKTTKYSENSIIIKAYTKQLGLQSFIINSVRGKRSKAKSAILQPLSIVDLEILHSEKKGLQRITEINFNHHFNQIPFNVIKSSISIFVNEILYKTLKEEQQDEDLFEFIVSSLQLLDTVEDNCSNFPVFFMLELTKYLGFYPQKNYSDKCQYFDLQEGRFVAVEPNHPYFVGNEIGFPIYESLDIDFTDFHTLKINNSIRKKILNALMEFYSLHIHGFGEVKSHKVLEEIIN